jgi:diguanylate cyclase (GGDEF)-like protein
VKLHFSRRLEVKFDGVVIVAVDAAYFVSGHEASNPGEHCVIGILAQMASLEGRTGDSVFSGEAFQYASVVSEPDAADAAVTVSTNGWDGVRRWTVARELYGFPLPVLVGISSDEREAAALRAMRGYFWRAAFASVLAVLLSAVLGRANRQLSQSRLRESEAKLTHARRVEYIAFHDGLTKHPNRSLFSKLLAQSISEARRYDRKLAVAFLDLDRFKQINDTLGREAGDHLLQEVAARLGQCVRDSDTVTGLGGDEFVVLLPQLDDGKYAAIVAQKILTAIAMPFTRIGHEYRVTAGIGISTYPQDGLDEQTLTNNADIAMYQAKEEGENNFQFYSAKLNAHSLERLTLESALQHALERNEFHLHYQTKRDIGSGRITRMGPCCAGSIRTWVRLR